MRMVMNLAVLERKGINVIEKPISTEAIIVRDSLIEHGLETPLIDNGLSNVEKYQRVKAAMTEVVSTLGLDLNDDSLAETPHRIAKMYVQEVFSGLDYSAFPKISVIENKMGADEMITDSAPYDRTEKTVR